MGMVSALYCLGLFSLCQDVLNATEAYDVMRHEPAFQYKHWAWSVSEASWKVVSIQYGISVPFAAVDVRSSGESMISETSLSYVVVKYSLLHLSSMIDTKEPVSHRAAGGHSGQIQQELWPARAREGRV